MHFQKPRTDRVYVGEFGFKVFRIMGFTDSVQYTPPRTGVFKPIRTDGTFDRWPKKIATQSSTGKIRIKILTPKNNLSITVGKSLKGLFWKINLFNTGTNPGSTTTQSPHM